MPVTDHGMVSARQRNSNKIAQAYAVVPAASAGAIQLNKQTGRPGDAVNVSGNGFQPGEKVNAFWGGIGGLPAVQLQADQNGGLSQARLPVGIAPTGQTTVLLVGDQSKTTATAPFYMQGLYPT